MRSCLSFLAVVAASAPLALAPCVACASFDVPGDADADGVVGLTDWNLVSSNLGAQSPVPGDVNGDGGIDLQDFGLMANNIGAVSPQALPLTDRGPASDLSVTITPTVIAAYDSTTFDPLPIPDPTQLGSQHEGVTLRVDFEMTAPRASLADPRFGNVAFSVGLGPGVAANPLAPTWTPNNPTVDINGPEPGGMFPAFGTNGDMGFDTTDFTWLTVSLPGGLTDPSDGRFAAIQDQPIVVGTLFVEWDGIAPSYLDVEMLGISEIDANGDLVEVDGAMAGGALSFGGGDPPLAGDYNGDGVVDAADYTVMRDGVEPIGDRVYAYLRWEENFGAGSNPPAPIPEPASAAIVACGLLAGISAHRAQHV